MKTVKYVPVHGIPETVDAVDMGLRFHIGEEKQVSDAQAEKLLANPNFEEVVLVRPAQPAAAPIPSAPPINNKEA